MSNLVHLNNESDIYNKLSVLVSFLFQKGCQFLGYTLQSVCFSIYLRFLQFLINFKSFGFQCYKDVVSSFNCPFCSVACIINTEQLFRYCKCVLNFTFFKVFFKNYFSLFICFVYYFLVVHVISSYLILFLDCQTSYNLICVIVSVNFLVVLFVFFIFCVSRCCCGVQVFPVSLVNVLKFFVFLHIS